MKKMKSMLCAIAIASILPWQGAYAQSGIALPTELAQNETQNIEMLIDQTSYTVGQDKKELKVAPYLKGNTPMISLDFVAEVVGLPKDHIEKDGDKITLFKDEDIIQINIGQKTMVQTGTKSDLVATPEIKEDTVMVPYTLIEKLSDKKMTYNSIGKMLTMEIQTSKEEVKDKDQDTKEEKTFDYTCDQLIEKALKNSKDLKKAEMNVDKAEEMKDDQHDVYKYSHPSENPKNPYNGDEDNRIKGYVGYKRTQKEHKQAEKQVEVTKDMIKKNVKVSYYDVLSNMDTKKIAVLDKEIKSKKAQQAKVKYDLGLMSELEKDQAYRDSEDAKKAYGLAEKNLEKSYETLNDLVGLKLSERYILEDHVQFEKIEDEDVDGHVARSIGKSPAIWALEQDVDLADLGLKMFVFNNGQSYDVNKIDARTKEIDLNQAKKDYEKNIKAMYNSLKQLEDQYEKAKLSYEKAVDDLKKVKVSLQIGNATPLDVDLANLQLENAKKGMRDIMIQYNNLAISYEKPWLGTGMTQGR